MSLWNRLFGNATAEAVPATVNAGANLVDSIMDGADGLFTSDEEIASLKNDRIRMLTAWRTLIEKNVHELNLANALSTNRFDSGWRPFIGWVLGLSIAGYFLPKFLIASAAWAYACWIYMQEWAALAAAERTALLLPSYPTDDAGLWQLTGMMLGGIVVRSIDKHADAARK